MAKLYGINEDVFIYDAFIYPMDGIELGLYEVYVKWYARTQSKLGKALK